MNEEITSRTRDGGVLVQLYVPNKFIMVKGGRWVTGSNRWVTGTSIH